MVCVPAELMDHISELPNDVLCHILSFLKTKQAAVTSVLSKRWVNVWTLVPKLEIRDYVFLHPEEGKGEKGDIQCSFMDFVDKALALQGDSSIKKFSLKLKNGVDTARVNRWICNVLQRGVSELYLKYPRVGSDNVLPKEVFDNETLVTLKLVGDTVDWCCHGTKTFLPMLEVLFMSFDRIVLHNQFEMFLHAFPVLEELLINPFEWGDSDETVSSASLKVLTLYAVGFPDIDYPKSISFDTPSLLYLDYSDFVAADYPIVNLTNLVEVELSLIVTAEELELMRAPDDEDDVFLRLRNVSKLINGIRNVKEIIFTAATLEVLSLCCESMPMFDNLKILYIMSKEKYGWQAMPVLLRNCPHLETLVLEGLVHYVTDKCGDACDCVSREEGKGRSLKSCPVKYLWIQGFKGTMRELTLIKHFLDYFPCLDNMKISPEKDDPSYSKDPGILDRAMEILNVYSEGSSCDISFAMHDEVDETCLCMVDDVVEKMDVFSNLPEELLIIFLSFLTTKEAASTSVLAKRWRNLFALVHDLDIDDSVLWHPKEGKREQEEILQIFMNFVDRILASQGDSPIEKFYLKCKSGVETRRVDRWIHTALQRGVTDLDLFIAFQNLYWLPQEVSVSKKLVELKIGSGFDLHWWPDDICLPMLKTLVLDSSGLRTGQFQNLLNACHVLEELHMTNMLWMNSDVTVFSTSLKELTIDLQGCCNATSRKSISS